MTVRFVVEREAMRRALGFAAAGVSWGGAPLLQHVRLTARPDGIVAVEALDAVDTCMTTAEVPAVGQVSPGELFWRPRALREALDACERGADITFERGAGAASLTDGRLTARAHQPDAAGWPVDAETTETWRTVVPAEQWAALAAPILAHMADDDARPNLQTAWLGADDQGAYVTAANGFRLYTVALPEGPPATVFIPREAWRRAGALRGDVTIALSERGRGPIRRVRLSAADARVEATVPEGLREVAWRKLVPDTIGTRATVDGPALRRVLRGVRALARDGSGIVRLYASPGGLRLSVRGAHDDDGVEIVLPAMVSGPTARVALDHRYLTDVVATATGPVEIGITGETSAGVFTFAGLPGATAIVMPMYVAS